DENVVGLSAEARGALLLERSDDLDALAVHRDDLAEGIVALEEGLGHVLADHADVRRVEDVEIGDVAAVLDGPVVADRVVLVHASDLRRVRLVAIALHLRGAPHVALGRDREDGGTELLKRVGVLDREVLSLSLFLRAPARPEPRLELLELD